MVERIQKEIHNTKNIFWCLTIGISLCLALYIYFVSHAVYAGVVRQQTEKAIRTIENSTEGMEAYYVTLKEGVTKDLAKTKGFTVVASRKYISRGTLGKGLSLNTAL